MKVVINRCYGGFGLSPLAVQRVAELRGVPCYFFEHQFTDNRLLPITIEQCKDCWLAYSVPDPYHGMAAWSRMTTEERAAANKYIESVAITNRPTDRADPLLVKVVEELGSEASGEFAALRVVEIPDGVDWEIDDYDGMETIREKSCSWC